MNRKTIGIIGKGMVITHFFSHLKDTALYLGQSAPDFLFKEAGKIIFYSPLYETGAHLEQSRGFQKIKDSLEKLVAVGPLVSGVSSSPSQVQLGAVSAGEFGRFLSLSDVLVDASKGYRPGELFDENCRPGSLYAYARESLDNVGDSSLLDWNKDYQFYLREEEEKKEPGRIVLTLEQFHQHWQGAYEILEQVKKVHKKYPLGLRMLRTFPFNARMMSQRGQQLQNYVQKNPRRVNLPTYINLVNEPCMTSLILAEQCPTMAPYFVASTGYDRDRLETMLNDNPNITAAKEKAGLADFRIKIHSIAGTHDTHLMIPVPAAPHIEDQEKIAAIFRHFKFDSLTSFMEQAVGQYWLDYNPASGRVERRDVNKEVDRSLFETIVTALQSRDRPLSLFPKERKTLNNGYFRALSADEKEGVFLTGNHRFHNGKVYSVPFQTPVKEVREFVSREEARVVNRLREVRAALPAVYSQEIKPAQITVPSASSSSSKEAVLEQLCFVSIDKSVHKLRLPTENEPMVMSSLNLPPRKYGSLGFFQIEGEGYLAAGHSRGIEVVNLHNDEKKTVSISVRPSVQDGVKDISLFEQSRELGILVASHNSAGIIYLPLEKLLDSLSLLVEPIHENLISNGNPQEPLRSKISSGKIYLAKSRKVYEMHGSEREELFSVPSAITALDLDAKGNIFTGTFAGNIYQNERLIYSSPRQDSGSYIAQLQPCSYQGKEGILFRTGRANMLSGTLQFTAHGAAEEILSLGFQDQLVGFSHSEQNLICATKDRLIIHRSEKEQVLPVTGRIRCLYTYGG